MNSQVKAYYDLANEYHISATSLWQQIMDTPCLYNPICYLLRHTIELQLKGLIVKELRKDNKKLVLKDIKLDSYKMNNVHSLLFLWEKYKCLLSSHRVTLNPEITSFVDNAITKIDKKDFSSTKYRYPFDKSEKAIKMFPVDISIDGKAPDLSSGVPTIIQFGSEVGVINKGQKSMMDTSSLFDVSELLFRFMEE